VVEERPIIPPEVKAEAAAWIARLHADSRTTSDERAFRRWIAERPCHAAAFDAVTTTWNAAGRLLNETPIPASTTPVREFTPIRRRAALVGLGTLVIAAGALRVWRGADADVFQTDVGEQKHLVLADDTQVFLDTDTCIRAQINKETRAVTLVRGRANFRIGAALLQPFVIEALERCTVAEKAVFDVQRDGGVVSLILIDGQAEVEPTRSPTKDTDAVVTPAIRMRTGERLVMNSGTVVRHDTPNLAPLLAWHTGQAVFDNDTLADAVAEMNRYSAVKLEIVDSSISSLRLSGVFRVGDNGSFARSIANLLHLDLQQNGDRILFVRRST
jgi:transmembrane sensor